MENREFKVDSLLPWSPRPAVIFRVTAGIGFRVADRYHGAVVIYKPVKKFLDDLRISIRKVLVLGGVVLHVEEPKILLRGFSFNHCLIRQMRGRNPAAVA